MSYPPTTLEDGIMMGRAGSSSTIGAMHVSSGLLALGVVRALEFSAERTRQLKAVDRAHAVGQAYARKRLQQRKANVEAEGELAMAQLLAARKRIHG